MRRPLALIGFTYLFALVAAVCFGESTAIVLAVLSFAIFIITLFIKSSRKNRVLPIAFCTASIAFGAYFWYCSQQIKPIQTIDGQDAVISGTICEMPYKSYNRYYYVIQTDSVALEGAPQHIKIRMSASSALSADVYDKVRGKVHFFLPTGSETGFTSKSYYASKQIYMLSYLYDYEDVQTSAGTQKPLYYYALKSRQAMLKALRMLLPTEQAALAGGVLLGDKQGMSQQVQTDFRDIGVSHLLAVSGMHTAVLGQLFMAFFLFLKVPKRLSAIFSAAGLFGFMAITGFTPSVMRAGIMSVVYLAGILFSRKSDALNSLGFSVLVLTAANPAAAGDIGLLLSFFATLGLILLCDKINARFVPLIDRIRYCKGLIKGILSTVSATLAATVFTLPITILAFGQISLVSVPANILLVFPSSVMMLCAAVAALLSFAGAFSFLAMPFALATGILNNYLIGCARLLASIPFAAVSASQGFVLLWLASAILLFAVAYYLRGNFKLVKITGLLSVILLLTGIFSYQVSRRNVTQLAVLNTGNGCSIILTKSGHAAIISCGGSALAANEINSFLRSNNCRQLDYMLLPQLKEETSSGAQEVLKNYHTAALVLPKDDSIEEKLLESVNENGNAYYFANSVHSNLWGEIDLLVTTSGKESVLTFSLNGITFVINPSGGNLQAMSAQERTCDFYIIGNSSQESSDISSAYTILSMDEETAVNALKNLPQKCGNPVLTATQGNIIIDTYGNHTVCIRKER